MCAIMLRVGLKLRGHVDDSANRQRYGKIMVWGSFAFVILMYAMELIGECIIVEKGSDKDVVSTFENWMVLKTLISILQTIVVNQICFYMAFMKMNTQSL